jgi:asparagine synthase (glutamine-hydrolysing)
MCGIFGYLKKDGNELTDDVIYKQFRKTRHRGPDKSTFSVTSFNDHPFIMGFHRLSIMGLESGDQPFCEGGVSLIVNGEIYNYKQLIHEHNLPIRSESDCEVIIHLYIKYGIEKTIDLVDGVWAFILADSTKKKLYFARDMYGVRPLFYADNDNEIVVASQVSNVKTWRNCRSVLPRHIYQVSIDDGGVTTTVTPYLDVMYSDTGLYNVWPSVSDDVTQIYPLFRKAVEKRLVAEKPLGFLLSGGLDSSLVLSVSLEIMSDKGDTRDIDVFTIGSKNESSDVTASLELVEWLRALYKNTINHHIVDFSEDDWGGFVVNDVIKHLESWDTTTVRASVPMYLLSKYIRENTDVKVIMSGEGADELFGGYLYFHRSPSSQEFEKESRRLLSDLYLYDVLRADRTTSAWGLEVRVPFLDKNFSTYVMSIKTDLKRPQIFDDTGRKIEKFLLRSACGNSVLPNSILWRVKNGMSDGVGTVYQKWVQTKAQEIYSGLSPSLSEREYYRDIFTCHYSVCLQELIPYTWMPQWSPDAGDDPSGLLLM